MSNAALSRLSPPPLLSYLLQLLALFLDLRFSLLIILILLANFRNLHSSLESLRLRLSFPCYECEDSRIMMLGCLGLCPCTLFLLLTVTTGDDDQGIIDEGLEVSHLG